MTRWIFLVVLILGLAMYAGTINSVQGIGLEVRNKQGGLVSSIGDTSSNTNSFEFGHLAIPLFITNMILLIFAVLYYKKKLPSLLQRIIHYILNFEISRKAAYVVIISLLGIFTVLSMDQFEYPNEEHWGDYQILKTILKDLHFNSIQDILNIRYFLHYFSLNVFGNVRIIAFIESSLLLIITYLITVEISKKRFAGIISMIVLLQSNLFLKYSVSATYDNLWTLFYVLSLYLIYKRWYLSPIAYAFALFSKALSVLFIPLTFFFIYRASTKENKKKLTAAYILTVAFVIIEVTQLYGLGTINTFYKNEFLTGFNSIGILLRSDEFVTLFLLPVIVGLFILSRRRFKQADSLMVLISGVLWFEPLLGGFTELTNQPYRFIPLIVFFAISVGALFSNTKIQQDQNKNYVSNLVFASTLIIVIVNLALVIFPALITGSYRVALD